MGHSQLEKAQSRERILAEAALRVKTEGLESLSVGKLMQSAGLTHGGFYGHFESRSALLTEALRRALDDTHARQRQSEAVNGPLTFAARVRGYLSLRHRDATRDGCAVAALVSDAGRADTSSRAVMDDSLEIFISQTTRQLGETNDEKAMVAVSAMIGALIVSRAITDPQRSEAVLQAVKTHLLALDDRPPA
ncbi:MAG: TetR/AcrR family transcriptional regulator [Caulobacteraceae bacterium]|nr:TetR/AcrR family transcriptional regulator [Caulobacteraceae bacterium]